MRIHPKYIQLIGDALIPILGFFFWEWNLYFIILFYLLDLFTKEILLHVKSTKINLYQEGIHYDHFLKGKKQKLKSSSLSIVLLSFSIFLIHKTMPYIQTGFDTNKQIVEFLSYKEMGIEQGYILIPLVIFMGYSQYKMEFLTPGLYTKLTIENLWRPHLISLFVLLAFIAISFGCVQFFDLPEWFFVIAIVLISSIFQLIFLKK